MDRTTRPPARPTMIDLDYSRTVDIEAIRLQYADKFATYTPKTPARQSFVGKFPDASTYSYNDNNSRTNGDSTAQKRRQYKLEIDPPLLNASSPWATDLEQLTALYLSPYTGAVTTRTSLLEGFNHDPDIHQHIFFSAGSSNEKMSVSSPSPPKSDAQTTSDARDTVPPPSTHTSSLNTYGYSPHTLSEYLGLVNEIVGQRHLGTSTVYKKPFIISVTGSPEEIEMSYALLANAAEMDEDLRLAMEVNLSCPNIADKPSPAFDETALKEYLTAISDSKATFRGRMSADSVPRVGIKLPPYTWSGQFQMVVSALLATKSSEPNEGSIIDFLTCTNTLGSCLVLDSQTSLPALSSESHTGIGGLAGSALHPLSLGNVATFRRLLDSHDDTAGIMIIGVGGVDDHEGFERMRAVGAEAVGVASVLGRKGVQVFESILTGETATPKTEPDGKLETGDSN